MFYRGDVLFAIGASKPNIVTFENGKETARFAGGSLREDPVVDGDHITLRADRIVVVGDKLKIVHKTSDRTHPQFLGGDLVLACELGVPKVIKKDVVVASRDDVSDAVVATARSSELVAYALEDGNVHIEKINALVRERAPSKPTPRQHVRRIATVPRWTKFFGDGLLITDAENVSWTTRDLAVVRDRRKGGKVARVIGDYAVIGSKRSLAILDAQHGARELTLPAEGEGAFPLGPTRAAVRLAASNGTRWLLIDLARAAIDADFTLPDRTFLQADDFGRKFISQSPSEVRIHSAVDGSVEAAIAAEDVREVKLNGDATLLAISTGKTVRLARAKDGNGIGVLIRQGSWFGFVGDGRLFAADANTAEGPAFYQVLSGDGVTSRTHDLFTKFAGEIRDGDARWLMTGSETFLVDSTTLAVLRRWRFAGNSAWNRSRTAVAITPGSKLEIASASGETLGRAFVPYVSGIDWAADDSALVVRFHSDEVRAVVLYDARCNRVGEFTDEAGGSLSDYQLSADGRSVLATSSQGGALFAIDSPQNSASR